MFDLDIFEVTKENKEANLSQIAELEIKVLQDMEAKGKIGQLFITGKDDIEEYIDSEDNTVMVALDKQSRVNAAAYITQNQLPFTYNDITKYFKYGNKYNEYIQSLYKSKELYQLDMLKAYELKMKAYEYARNRVLAEHTEYKTIYAFLEHELNDKDNKFHEKSELRDSINKYMSLYIQNETLEKRQLYGKFYWTTISDIEKELSTNIDKNKIKNLKMQECDAFLDMEKPKEHEEIVKKGKLKIYNEPNFDVRKYYTANTNNTVEIDTYITDPENRQYGLARIVVFEGIKKHIKKYFKNSENKEIFLCSTLHKDNLSSKYVSEFFGLKDNLYVNRRQGRDREVHICKISRENAQEYLKNMENRLIVLYGYNPNNKKLSYDEQISVLNEQLQYEKSEVSRLKKLVHKRKKRFKSKKNYLKGKRTKTGEIENKIKKLKQKKYEMEETCSER